MKRWLLALTVPVVLLTGCSSGSEEPTPPPPASSAPAPEPPPTPSPTPAACPDGSYRLTALEGRGSGSAFRSGTGGDVAVAFTGGVFTISSEGAEPVRVDLGPTNADLRLAGRITGTYAGDPAALQLGVTDATGGVTVRGLGVSRELSAGELADQLIGSSTTAAATCRDDGSATLDLPRVRLDLVRA